MASLIVRVGLTFGVGLAAAGCKPEPAAPPATAATSASSAAEQPEAPSTPVATQPASTSSGETGVNPLYTLPPSQGPAVHAFAQVTLLRSGVSGDLEMQLTGDGIYRIRDHGRGQSYAGNGRLEEAQIAEWAALMKDWESLKDNYVPTPAPENADKIDIMYGGKKVSFSTEGKDNPALAQEVYKRMLALNEQSKKESGVSETSAPAEK